MIVYESSKKKQIIFILIVFAVLSFTFVFGFVYDSLTKDNNKLNDKPKIVESSGLDLPNNIKDIEGDYVTIDFNKIEIANVSDEINDSNLSKYSNKFKEIIGSISSIDRKFDSKNYKIYYQNDYEDKVGYLDFVYYLSDNIETNKIYRVSIENSNVKSIILNGIRKENVDNLAKADVTILNQKITNFEKNKAEILLARVPNMFTSNNILDNNGNIKLDSINKIFNNIKEKYYYDYNFNKLLYRLGFVINSDKIATLGQVTEFEL